MSSTPGPGPESDRPPRLRPSRWWPVAGALVGGGAGLAYYLFWGCKSG